MRRGLPKFDLAKQALTFEARDCQLASVNNADHLEAQPAGPGCEAADAGRPTHRFEMQLCRVPEPGIPETWQPLQSFPSPRESLAACSECVEAVQLLLGIDPIGGPEPTIIKLRVWDRQHDRQVLWEDAQGALCWLEGTFPDAAPFEPAVKTGMKIDDSDCPWTDWILDGIKTIETRRKPSLRPHLGKRIGVIRTGRGAATLLGYVTILAEKEYGSLAEFVADTEKHRVRTESPEFRFAGPRFGYLLGNPSRTSPLALPNRTQRATSQRL